MYGRVIEWSAFILQHFFNVVDKRRRGTQHVDILSVNVLRHVNLVPELCKVRHVQHNALVRNHRTKADDRLRQALLVDSDTHEKVDQQVVRLVELVQRRIICCVNTLIHAEN